MPLEQDEGRSRMSLETTSSTAPRAVLSASLTLGGVEQPEGDVQGFAEASVVVVMNIPAVHDGADPEPAVAIIRVGKAGVVAREQPVEGGKGKAQQQCLVGRVDQGKQAIAAVGEPVAAARGDSC